MSPSSHPSLSSGAILGFLFPPTVLDSTETPSESASLVTVGGAAVQQLTLEYLSLVRATYGSAGVSHAYGCAIRLGFYFLCGCYSMRGETLSFEEFVARHLFAAFDPSADCYKLCQLFKTMHKRGDYRATGTDMSQTFCLRSDPLNVGFYAPLTYTYNGHHTNILFNDAQDFLDFAAAVCDELERGR